MPKAVFVSPDRIKFERWIKQGFKSAWLRLALLVIISLLGVGVQLLNPWPLKFLVDSVFGNVPAPGVLRHMGKSELLLVVGLGYVAIILAGGIIDILSQYLTSYFSYKMGLNLKSQMFHHIISLPLMFKRKLQSGDYVYRLNEEADDLPAIVYGTSTGIIGSIITILAASVILAFLNWRMAIISVFVAPLLYYSIRFFTPKIEAASNDIEVATSDIYNYSSESIENADTIQAFNREGYQTIHLQTMLNGRIRQSLHLSLLSSEFDFTNNLFTGLGVGIIVILGGARVGHGITLGELLIFITYMSYFYEPLQTLLSNIGDYKALIAGAKRVFAVLDTNTVELTRPAEFKFGPRAQGLIQFKDITFSYGNRLILDKVSFDIMPGQKVAFVGPSGQGKSTILSLLPRFNQADSGFIYLDQHEIRDIELSNLRDQLAIVTQQPALFSGTIHDNIGFAKPGEKFDLPDIIAAAKAANAWEFIDKLPNKFEENVGESGNSLSGGQQQRIAIARAFLKDAPIILLDEPTSAQDTESSNKIIGAIKRLMAGKTVLMSTHETSLLKEMDAIYVVDGAKVQDIAAYGGVESYIQALETQPPALVDLEDAPSV